MRFLRYVLSLILLTTPVFAQIPPQQIALGGNVGCAGFPCLNSGTLVFASDANHTLTALESTATGGIKVTSGVSLTATRNLILPTAYGRLGFLAIENATTGGQSIQVIGQTGTGFTIANGSTATVWYDGTNVVGAAAGGATFPATTNLIKGTGTANVGAAGVPGTDYPGLATANTFTSLQTILTADISTSLALGYLSNSANPLCYPSGAVTNIGCTGSGSGTVSGQAANVIPLGTSATVIGAQSHLTDNGTTVASTEQVSAPSFVSGTPSSGALAALPTGAHGIAGDESATAGVPASGVDYVRWSSTTHQAVESANGTPEVPLLTGPCPLQNATNICLTQAPYYASTAGGTTTTISGSLTSGSTTATVASCSTFLPNEGIFIAGAGTSSANYLGTVTSCTGTTMVWSPATATTVSSPSVQHDESATFNAAIAALTSAGSGTIWLPAGVYRVNGPLLQTGGAGANAVIAMPQITNNSGTYINIGIEGYGVPNQGQQATQYEAVINTQISTGNLIGGEFNTGGPYPPFTNVTLTLHKLVINDTTANTNAVMVNCTAIEACRVTNVSITNQGALSTSTSSGGLWMPAIANAYNNVVDELDVNGWWKNVVLTEHTHVGTIYSAYGTYAAFFDNGTNGGSLAAYNGNSVSVDYLWMFYSTYGIGAANHTVVNIQNADFEGDDPSAVPPAIADIYDPTNQLYGYINFLNPYQTLGNCVLTIVGASHVVTNALACATAGTGVPQKPTSGMIENWNSQEGQGTTLVNSGFDFSNSLTTSNVTWATATGFTGNVATYNGSTSSAIASNGVNTGFDGSTPFSICAWHNPTTWTGVGDVALVTNAGTVSGTLVGFLFGEFGSTVGGVTGSVKFYFLSNGTTNWINMHGPAGAVVPGQANHECVTYSGSGTAAGVSLYVNGVLQTPTVANDNFSGPIATTLPVNISPSGSAESGAIGQILIFNRVLSAADITNLFALGPKAY